MRKIILGLLLVPALLFAEGMVTAVRGTITKMDASTKTIVLKTADGTEHSVHFAEKTTVHGVDAASAGATDSWRGLKEGTEVVVHYSKQQSDQVAVEIDRVGQDGMKATEGTISKVDREGKTIVVKTGSGAEETFHMTDYAAKDAGKDIAAGTEKGAKVTVYYTEKAGKKIVHFFQ